MAPAFSSAWFTDLAIASCRTSSVLFIPNSTLIIELIPDDNIVSIISVKLSIFSILNLKSLLNIKAFSHYLH